MLLKGLIVRALRFLRIARALARQLMATDTQTKIPGSTHEESPASKASQPAAATQPEMVSLEARTRAEAPVKSVPGIPVTTRADGLSA